MPEYLAPGVYVEEISTGPKPIEGVSTSVAGFIGPTERGPERSTLITSWLAYQRWYGGHLPADQSFMTAAVQGFFDNRGKRCFVSRVASATAVAAGLDLGGLVVSAYGKGTWGHRVFIMVKPATKATAGVERARDWFRVIVLYYGLTTRLTGVPLDPTDKANLRRPEFVPPDAFEDYDDLTHETGAANNVKTTINLASKLIQVSWTTPAAPVRPPAVDAPTPLAGGSDGGPLTLTDYLGREGRPGDDPLDPDTGFVGLGRVDEVSLVVAPDHLAVPNLTETVVTHCETFQDRFAILGSPRDTRPGARPMLDTKYAAQYHPWIKVYDQLTRDDVAVPPVGHVAGIIARTDIEYGVHKAPANAVVVGARDLDVPVTKGDQDLFNPAGINCVRDFRPDGRGLRLWGARTMSSDPEWKYVNVRRLFLFVEESIDQGTQWVVFEPNSDPTWARVVRTVTGFLTTVWRSGALMGTTPDEAFFVRCDRTTMTQDDIDNGRLICYIGIAPVKPAEFVIFRIGQMTADAQS